MRLVWFVAFCFLSIVYGRSEANSTDIHNKVNNQVLKNGAKSTGVVTINPQTTWGTWTGWGTSLAWWAQTFGTRTDIADALFTLSRVHYNGQTIPGLGFNIVRYNAGASSWNKVEGKSMQASPNIPAFRQIPGYWLDWYSADPSSSSWNWSVDANQRNMMRLARDRGVNHFELFSNSPMWWMLKNSNPSGASDGGNNLQSWNYYTHTVYLATIAAYAKQHWGISFESVEPVNEPIANWWKANNNQEGCHFDVSLQASLFSYLRTELNKRGLSSVIVSGSDENTYDQALSTLNRLGSAVNNIGRVNVHGYQNGDGDRSGLYEAAKAKNLPIWNSEYGENDSTGRTLVSNLILDFRWLHPTAWVYWQALDWAGWGLIDGHGDSGWLSPVIAQKYFILAQFSRHIREGMTILDGGSDNTVAAYDSRNQKLVIVVVNWGNAQYLNFDLSRFIQPSTNGALVKRWQTLIGDGTGDRYAYYEDIHINGTRFRSWFPQYMVQTFEVTHVRI